MIAIHPLNTYGANSIYGNWKDKSQPDLYGYEFNKNNEFVYIYNWVYKGTIKSSTNKGVWEIGKWIVTSPNGLENSCNLTVHADTHECCFDYKFIADNLILTNKYKSGYTPMCENRVLIKGKPSPKSMHSLPAEHVDFIESVSKKNGCNTVLDIKFNKNLYKVSCESKKLVFECNFKGKPACYLM